jgi:hypothetical protein
LEAGKERLRQGAEDKVDKIRPLIAIPLHVWSKQFLQGRPLKDSQLSLFIEKLKSDPALLHKVKEGEKLAAARTTELVQQAGAVRRENLAALEQIALEAGFNIAGDMKRPADVQIIPSERDLEHPDCPSTCCWVETSVGPPKRHPD